MDSLFDKDRVQRIASAAKDMLEKLAILSSRTEDPLFIQLIELSSRWWTLWLAAGMAESAGVSVRSDLGQAMLFAIDAIEHAIINRTGRRPRYDVFLEWAHNQGVGYKQPLGLLFQHEPPAPPSGLIGGFGKVGGARGEELPGLPWLN
jgi:hypothetical protein